MSGNTDNTVPPSRFNTLVSSVAAVMAVVASGYGVYTADLQNRLAESQTLLAERQNEFSNQIAAQKNLIEQQRVFLERRSGDRSYDVTLVKDFIFPALETSSRGRIQVLQGMVISHFEVDQGPRQALREALLVTLAERLQAVATQEMSTPKEREEATIAAEALRGIIEVERSFTREQAERMQAVPTHAPPEQPRPGQGSARIGQGWRWDVFSCELATTPRQAQLPTSLADQIRRESAADVRARVLPASLNASPGYGVRGRQIRHEAHEKAHAEQVQALLQRVTGQSYDLYLVRSVTSNYLSIFDCS